MDSVKLRKGATRIKANGETVSENLIALPKIHLDNLGWKSGDNLIVESDKRTGKLTIKKDEKNER